MMEWRNDDAGYRLPVRKDPHGFIPWVNQVGRHQRLEPELLHP